VRTREGECDEQENEKGCDVQEKWSMKGMKSE
jgi:hypothetical protein